MSELKYSIDAKGILNVAVIKRTANDKEVESKKPEPVQILNSKGKNVEAKFRNVYTLEVIDRLEEIQEKAIENPTTQKLKEASEIVAKAKEEAGTKNPLSDLTAIVNAVNTASISDEEKKAYKQSQRQIAYEMFDYMCVSADCKAENQDWRLIINCIALFRERIAV